MKVRVAYLEEPPFYWTAENDSATGADIELADVVLRAIGVSSVEHHRTSFEELLPGVQEGRWDMNVPIFVTAGRAERVAFSVPVWSLGDGFLLRQGNPKALASYVAVAARKDARLGVVAGTVQLDAARSAGVRDDQIVAFKDQTDAMDALRKRQRQCGCLPVAARPSAARRNGIRGDPRALRGPRWADQGQRGCQWRCMHRWRLRYHGGWFTQALT